VSGAREKGDLEIKNLEFKFAATDSKMLLKNLVFEMGKIYGIIGANGLGKSTFIRCMIGVERKSKEEIYLNGKKLSKRDRIKMSSLVMQDVNQQLFADSVIKEVSLGIKDIEEGKVKKVLESLDLYELKDSHPMSLSGGQKQRLAIASVILKNSQLIFFDEPTSGMDYANMIKISEMIKECKRNDKIIFIVSHDTEFLNATVDYFVDMKKVLMLETDYCSGYNKRSDKWLNFIQLNKDYVYLQARFYSVLR
jgi:energy-coupling factor transport system ATP-binding protein